MTDQMVPPAKAPTAGGIDFTAIVAAGGAEALRRYWTSGEGGALVRWGTPGDFMRCVRRVTKYMTDEQAKGFCANMHHRALGIWPAEHK